MRKRKASNLTRRTMIVSVKQSHSNGNPDITRYDGHWTLASYRIRYGHKLRKSQDYSIASKFGPYKISLGPSMADIDPRRPVTRAIVGK